MTKEEAADKAMECLTGCYGQHLEALGQRWQAGEKITNLAQPSYTSVKACTSMTGRSVFRQAANAP